MKNNSTNHAFTAFARKLSFTVCFLALSVFAFAQQRVTGTVTDAAGEPVIGASVVVEGTTTGTTTGVNGQYSLAVPAKSTLVFSFLGYKEVKVEVAGKTSIDITMTEDAAALDEVVVIGYGTVKKRDLTGAVSSVKADVVKLTPSANPMESLQGRIAGLDITKSSGQAGAGVSMQLRGNRSISEGGNPLILIDGMPGSYSSLNPNDIESIDVLKDASATAVYGSSGSNGVIIITTKKGKEGQLSVNFDAYVGISDWSVLPEKTPQHYVATVTEAQKWAGTYDPSADVLNEAMREAFDKGHIIDWPDAILNTGVTQNYSLSVSGGTQKTQAYFSVNYSEEQGQYKRDNYKLYSSMMRINHNINKWFSAGIHTQLSYSDKESSYSKLEQAMRANPFGQLYKEDGSVNEYPVIDDNRQVNLLLNEDRDVYRRPSNSFSMYFQPYVRLTPLKGLTLESRVSAAISYSNSKQWIGFGSYQFYDAAGTGAVDAPHSETANFTSASVSNSRSWGYTWENILTYNFSIAKDHEFTVTGVTSYSHSQNESSSASATGFTTNAYKWTNLNKATGTKSVSSGYSMGKSMGLVARLNYSYRGKYLFSASIRHDANSKLAEDCRWDTFPAVSAGWRISEEKFMDGTKGWLDNLKLRVGYGETGAAGINAYSSWSILNQGIMSLGGVQTTNAYFPTNITNAALGWERSKSWNFGIDASFFNNRIDLSAEYYIVNTDDVIWNLTLPITNGGANAETFFTTTANMAKTQNKGVEVTLTTRNIVKRDFQWTSTITFAKNKEQVKALGEGAAEFVQQDSRDEKSYTLHIGDPVKSYWHYKLDGVWQKGEEADAAAFGKIPGDLKVNVPGMEKVSDGVWRKAYEQEDGTVEYNEYTAENPYSVSAADKQMIGHNTPDWQFGFQNTFTYKWFDLSIYMYGRFGQMMYYDPLLWYSSSGGNFPDYFNYWTPENPSNDFPSLNSSRNWKDDSYYTARAFVDGSFFKIKNITLGYTLGKKACSKIGLKNFRVYATITNPLVVAKSHLVENYDPEMNGSLDFPLTKQVVFGVNLSF
ncbi:MAG: TonB-dependent receptor [Alistipes sp.]|nr:TonB-dependent receptor [Alistipes sp.]